MVEHNDMRLLIVGDEVAGVQLLEHALARAGYDNVRSTRDWRGARQLCAIDTPDLILLDPEFPGAGADHAIEQLLQLATGPQAPPVLTLIAQGTPPARRRFLCVGAHDFVTKPIDETELLLRVRNALAARKLQQELRERNALISEALPKLLKEAVHNRTHELESARVESLTVLASIAEYHDDDNYQHTQRVGISAALIARALELPESFIDTIRDAAPLHDIGKVGISRRILLKPGQLTPAEWIHMTRHVEIGARILASAKSPALRLAAEIARTHHERWDGDGYLAGLAGEDIPLSGRITAVADVFDVITHDRPYKRAWDTERALAEVQTQSGRQFDPRVVAAFMTIDPQTLGDDPAGVSAQHAA